MRPLILAAILGAGAFARPSDEKASTTGGNPGTYRTILEFDVISAKDAFSQTVGDGLTLRVERERAVGLSNIGWSLSVTRAHSQNNLLIRGRRWHGPQPSDLLAWHFAGDKHLYDDTRILPVYEYPLEL